MSETRSFLSLCWCAPPWRAKPPVGAGDPALGTIGSVTPLRTALALSTLNEVSNGPFSARASPRVALVVNSPGGSAVQASLIAARIRELAAKHEVRVLTFIEDIAASGGYWLACAGDEIYADASSIVGSIGVVSAGFGFVEAIRKLGIERRVHTAGANKAILDPFRPERPEDVERLKSLQLDVHEEFKTLVRNRRAGRLDEGDADLFTGAFWSGRRGASSSASSTGSETCTRSCASAMAPSWCSKSWSGRRQRGGGASIRSAARRSRRSSRRSRRVS